MVEYPADSLTQFVSWLTALNTAIGTAVTGNPYSGLTPYDPSTDVTSMVTAITTFLTNVNSVDPDGDVADFVSAAATIVDTAIDSEAYITARIDAHASDLDTELTAKVIPRFEVGMRDINAVMSSAFAIGRAIIEKDRNDKVDKFASDLRLSAYDKRSSLIQSFAAEMSRIYLQTLEYRRAVAAMFMDNYRISIAAETDYATELKSIAADSARWPLEVYKYGANMLASISGGTTASVPTDGNKSARVIGSGLSGAAAGAMVGAYISKESGGGIGALIGGIAGLLGGS